MTEIQEEKSGIYLLMTHNEANKLTDLLSNCPAEREASDDLQSIYDHLRKILQRDF